MDQSEFVGIPADAKERKFTGIWIPAEIWLDDNLPALAKLLYAEIAGFGKRGCWKKSEELMQPLGIKSTTFQQLCKLLRDRGYIVEQRMFGRIVRTTTLSFASPQNLHQRKKRGDEHHKICGDEQAVSRGVHKEYTKEYISNEIRGENVAEPVGNSFGREDINELAELWEHETGVSIKGQQNQRRQLYNLTRKYGLDKTRGIIKLTGRAAKSQDRYAPIIATPSELTGRFEKLSKLRLWYMRNKTTQPTNTTVAAIKREGADYNGAWDDPGDAERARVREMFKQARADGVIKRCNE